jgi:membrane protease YdiL (CAAX protease family)
MTWVISWSLFYLSGVLSVMPGNFLYDTRWLIAQIGVFGPSISALLISGVQSRELRRNGFKIFSLFLLIFIAGVVITRYSPRSIQDFTPLVSIIVVTVGIVPLIFFSSLNRRLLIPATGEIQGNARMKGILLAILGVPLLFFIGWIIVNIPDASWAIDTLKNGPTSFVTMLVTAFFMNLIFGGSMGEELGWRGFALPLLLKKYSPLQASYVLGLMQAFWHLPGDISGADLAVIGAVLLRIGWSIAITIIFTWFYLNFEGKLLIAILLHTTVNVLPDLGFSRYEYSIFVLAFLLVVASIIVTRTQSMKRQESRQDNQ